MGEMQFLAATHVAASKYQLKSLEDKTFDEMEYIVKKGKMRTEQTELIKDFLNAVRTVIAGTARRKCRMRKLMVDHCFWNLPALTNGGTQASELLTDLPEVGAEVFQRLTSGCELSPLEGSWYADGSWWPDAIPCCAECYKAFSRRLMLSNRNQEYWECSHCNVKSRPVDGSKDEDGNYQSARCSEVVWVWEADHPDN